MTEPTILLGGVRLRVTDNGDTTFTLKTDASGDGETVIVLLSGIRLRARDHGDGTATLRVV